jgi:transcriptional regulator with XRE-family HTH domain
MVKSYISATDRELLASIGQRLRALRKARGVTQEQAAERAGLARSTVSEAERGDNTTMLTVIRLLRVYGRLGALESFIPEPELSPMARLRERQRKKGEGHDRPVENRVGVKETEEEGKEGGETSGG